jgi:hypothetical protein
MDDISLALNPPQFVKSRSRKAPIRIARRSSPVWPLAALNGREPVVLATMGDPPRGIELAYARVGVDDAIKNCPVNSVNGTATHLMPHMTPALAVDDGEIMFAGRHGHGYGVIINHNNGWSSYYAHLEAIVAIRTDLYRPHAQYVRAGDAIGYVGAPEIGAFKRLYFELWQLDRSNFFAPVDPRARLAGSKVLQHYDHFTPAPPAAQKEAA